MTAGVPPRQLHVLVGRFDPEAGDEGIRRGYRETRDPADGCPQMDTRSHRGVEYYEWEDGLDDANRRCRPGPAVLDFGGRGDSLAIQKQYVLGAYNNDGMERLIDTGLGELPSLADNQDFRLLARGMTELGAYSAYMSDETQSLDATLAARRDTGESLRVFRESLEASPLLRPYRAFATGAGKDEQGEYMALALVHDKEADAEDNVDLLRRRLNETSSFRSRIPWSDVFDTVNMEVRADGRLVLARVPREPLGNLWFAWIILDEWLLLHE